MISCYSECVPGHGYAHSMAPRPYCPWPEPRAIFIAKIVQIEFTYNI